MVDVPPLERPSDEVFPLLFRTVWSPPRCSFLNPISDRFCCSTGFPFVCLMWLFWLFACLSAYVPEPWDPFLLPTLLPLSQHPSLALWFSILFPSPLPSLHKVPPPPPFLLLFILHSFLSFFLFSSFAVHPEGSKLMFMQCKITIYRDISWTLFRWSQ